MNNLAGWKIDLEAVYGASLWKDRSRFSMREQLYESPDGSCAVLLFGIGEVGVNRQVARAALFKEKSAPRMTWSSGRTLFWYEGHEGEPVAFSEDGSTALLFEFVESWRGRLSSPRRRLDLSTSRLEAS